MGDKDLKKIDEYLDQFNRKPCPEISISFHRADVIHIETPDRNFFYIKCPYCETKNSIAFNPEIEVQFQTCEKCEKQFLANWSKVR